MNRLRSLLAALHRRLGRLGPARHRLDRDVREELEFHLAMRAEALRRDGLDADTAARQARLRLGNPALLREDMRTMWTFAAVETWWADLRYASRSLRRAPAFSLVSVALLGLGIGATAAAFALIDAVVLRGLPFRNASELVVLIGNVERSERVERRGGSHPDFRDWVEQSRSFSSLAAYDAATVTLPADGGRPAERLGAELISAAYLETLGVEPVVGRDLRADEDAAGADAVVLVGHGLWLRRFGGDPALVGRSLSLDGRPRTVIGILPPAFTGLTDQAELFIPFATSGRDLAQRGSRSLQAVGRLRAGGSLDAVRLELATLSKRLETAYPDTNAKRGVEVSPLDIETFGSIRRSVLALFAAVFLVLIIACSNVGSLLVGRSESRRREIAVRTALGADRRRLSRLLLSESLLLALISTGLGLLLAHGALRLLVASTPIQLPGFVTPAVDLRLSLFALALGLLCGLLLGIAPVLHATVAPAALTDSLKSAARGSDGARSSRLRSVLVVVELALSVVLLVAAGLMIRTVRNLVAVEPGFAADRVHTLSIGLPAGISGGVGGAGGAGAGAAAPAPREGPTPPRISALRVVERLRGVPGVESVALASDVPLGGSSSAVFYSAEGDSSNDAANAQTMPRAYVHRISPDFFALLGVPLRAGAFFTADARATEVIVSEAVARRFWPGQNAIGKRLKIGPVQGPQPWLDIVGVVPELKYRGLPDNPTADPDLYFPFAERAQYGVLVRGAAEPVAFAGAVRAAIREIDPDIVVYAEAPLAQLIRDRSAQPRFLGWLLSLFAGAALVLAAIGVFGVMNYLVSLRRREFGIRAALGADPASILRLVLGHGLRLVGWGVGLGLLAALGVGSILDSLLYGVSTLDTSAAAAVVVLALAAAAACLVPALRATRVHPAVALRNE